LLSELPHSFQILDHGGVLLLVPWRRMASSLLFSIDEGFSLVEYTFLDDTDFVAGEFTVAQVPAANSSSTTATNTVACERVPAPTSNTVHTYECVRALAAWSPAELTVAQGNAQLTFAAVGVSGAAVDCTVQGVLSGTTFTWEPADPTCGGLVPSLATTTTWTQAAKAKDVLIQAVVTEPGGSTAVAVLYWYDLQGWRQRYADLTRFRLPRFGVRGLPHMWEPERGSASGYVYPAC
jgi:hypothetical protein